MMEQLRKLVEERPDEKVCDPIVIFNLGRYLIGHLSRR